MQGRKFRGNGFRATSIRLGIRSDLALTSRYAFPLDFG